VEDDGAGVEAEGDDYYCEVGKFGEEDCGGRRGEF
jgi:hypothetical protein